MNDTPATLKEGRPVPGPVWVYLEKTSVFKGVEGWCLADYRGDDQSHPWRIRVYGATAAVHNLVASLCDDDIAFWVQIHAPAFQLNANDEMEAV
jgi:hypothetical protein